MIQRLRPLPSPEELAVMYAQAHDHRIYGRGHHERVEATIGLAFDTLTENDRWTVADLSCGNGVIATRIATGSTILGDFGVLPADLTPGDPKWRGRIEETITEITEINLFVLSETLEHLDDPLAILRDIRAKAFCLLLSTPLECWEDTNAEHLWAWDREGVEGLAAQANWLPIAFTSVDSREYGEPYLYGIWVFE